MWRPRSRAGYGAVLLLGSIALLLLLNAREILLVPPTIALGGKSLDQIFPDPRKVRDHYRQPQQQIQNGGEERRSATRTKIWPFKPHTAPSSWELGVEPWYQARKSAVCLTFDDNPGPLETPGPGLLDEMRFKGTFFVTPEPPVGKKEQPHGDAADTPGSNRDFHCTHCKAPDWQVFWDLLQRGHEIAAHTWHYVDLLVARQEIQRTQDLIRDQLRQVAAKSGSLKGQEKDTQRLLDNSALTMSYPYGGENEQVAEIAAEFHIGARTTNNHLLLKRSIGAICEDLGDKDPLDGGAGLQIYEIPASGFWRSSTKLVDLHRRLARVINGSGLFVELFHGMDGAGQDPIRSEIFEDHLRHLRNLSDHGLVWVATFADILKYIHERAVVEVEYLREPTEGTVSDDTEERLGDSKDDEVILLSARVGLRKAFVLERLKKERPGMTLHPLSLSVWRNINREEEGEGEGGKKPQTCNRPIKVLVDGEPVKTVEIENEEGDGSTRFVFEVLPTLTGVRNIEIRC